jgi:NTP pyrophosphatase (non-canonical NTP hydrolase)
MADDIGVVLLASDNLEAQLDQKVRQVQRIARARGQRAANGLVVLIDGLTPPPGHWRLVHSLREGPPSLPEAVQARWDALDEELGELAEALGDAGDPDVLTGRAAKSPATLAAAKEELGDVISVLVNLGRRSGIDAEAALRSANEKFRRRFGDVERRAAARAIDLKSADFAVLDGLWDEAKAAERGEGGAK